MTDETKQRAIEALLQQPTLCAAAEAAGVSRRSIYNWLNNDPAFAEAFQQQRISRAVEREEALIKQREEAIHVVQQIMLDSREPGAVRLKAAGKLLEEAHAAQVAVDGIAKSLSFEAKWF